MALTDLEKRELDNAILGLSLDKYGSFTNKDVIKLLSTITGKNYSIQSVVSAIARIYNDESCGLELVDLTTYKDKINVYCIKAPKCVINNTTFVKDKNIISFAPSCSSRKNETILTYDFITKKFNLDLDNEVVFKTNDYCISLFKDKKIFENEWLFNYLYDL